MAEAVTTGGSILSFPNRGPWRDPGYRGNCSGYVYREIFAALHPRVFTDPMVGAAVRRLRSRAEWASRRTA
jgi:hypothetical protein